MERNEDYLHVDGADIYYRVFGNFKGKPLVMLHGGLGCMYDLDSILDHIPSHYMIVTVDLRGHGKSSLGPEQLSYARYQQDIELLLAHLNITTYSLFGFSDGGIVGYRMAADNPDKVKQLITLGSQWRLEPGDPSIKHLQNLTSEFWIENFADDVARYNKSNPQPNLNLLVDKVKSVWLDTSASGYPNESVTRIICPTLVMRGDNDFLFSLQEAQLLIEKLADSSFMNIPFTQHEAYKEYPEVVGLVMNKFLSCGKN